ncbi:MAG: carboxypeptidase-like regulatory domain-containing protein [Cyclobacteriaceae bacterium]
MKVYLLGFILIFSFIAHQGFSQGDSRVVQFSGIVVGEDSTSGVPGVHIYVPKAGRGTTTNPYGYFSMPVLEGDSLIISAVSYTRQHFIIPKGKSDKYTVIIELSKDTTYLPELEVFPYPTEELFKEAVLALELPNQGDLNNLRRNLDEAMLRKMFANTAMGPSSNHNYFVQQQMAAWNNRFQPTSISLLNPFAWSQFIKSIKRGDLKKKK